MTLLHRPTSFSTFAILTVLSGPVLGLAGCSDDDEPATSDAGGKPDASTKDSGANPDAGAANGPLVILTERTANDMSLHYLHVVEDWPESGELDYDKALELGQPGIARVLGSELFFYHAAKGEFEKFTVAEDLTIERGAKLSFGAVGIMGFDPEPIWVSKDLAFMVDEKTAQVAQFNPSTMKLGKVTKIDPNVLERDGLKVQMQLGVAADERLFTTVSYRSWETNTVYKAAVLGVFDQNDPATGPTLIEDQRCAASVTISPFVDGNHVYAVGDGVNGFDILANPKMTEKPQCVVRLPVDGDAFEEDYFIDIQEVTGSPAIYMAYPMDGHKLLVSMWSPDVEVSVAKKDATKADWFWEAPPYYQYAIIDLETKKVTEVDLPQASMRSAKVLIADQRNYVQTFRSDKGSDVHRIDPDGAVTEVLHNASGTNVQFVGRLTAR
jgi:hypothetical protein